MRAPLLAGWLTLVPLLIGPGGAAGQDRDPLFTGGDALWAAGFAVGTVALAPVDVRVAEAIQDSALQERRWLGGAAKGFEFLGYPGSLVLSGGMYVAGRLTDRQALADIGLHTGEAIVLAELVTYATKFVAGRARPSVNVREPFDFGLGRGLRGHRYQSLPSGHTAAAFATAAAITSEIGRRWPGWEVPAGGAIYTGAALTGVSRVYHNEHWASDVMLGAAIGSFAGWKLVRYTHDRPGSPLERWLLGISIAPAEGGRTSRLWIAPSR